MNADLTFNIGGTEAGTTFRLYRIPRLSIHGARSGMQDEDAYM